MNPLAKTILIIAAAVALAIAIYVQYTREQMNEPVNNSSGLEYIEYTPNSYGPIEYGDGPSSPGGGG